jgi:alanyl-tRNA synthetase
LSAKPAELGERVERLQSDVRDMQRSLAEIKARMAAADASSYVESAQTVGSTKLVSGVAREANADAIKALASAIRQKFPGGVIALAGVDGDAVSLLVTAGDEAVKAGAHAGNLLKVAAPFVDGKGGGQAAQAQGGGRKPAGAEAALDAIRKALA